MFLGASEQEIEVALLGSRQPRQVRYKQDTAGRPAQQVGWRLAQTIRGGQKWRSLRHKQPGEHFSVHASFTAQQKRHCGLRQLSQAPCIYGRSWAYDDRGIWVADGCQADFNVGYTTVALNVTGDGRWIRCESRDFRETGCSIRCSVSLSSVTAPAA